MPSAEFFARFHLFVVKDFLDPDLCARLGRELGSAAREPATVRTQGSTYTVETGVRSVQWAEVAAPTVELARQRLADLQPQIERYFQIALAGCQRLQFLAYSPGDFYRAHRDSSSHPDAAEITRQRRISVVIFLNSQSPEPREGCYCGGSLTFYGLMDDARGRSLGFPLAAEAGLLIAFPSTLLHEVTPVTHGERYTIASWYY